MTDGSKKRKPLLLKTAIKLRSAIYMQQSQSAENSNVLSVDEILPLENWLTKLKKADRSENSQSN